MCKKEIGTLVTSGVAFGLFVPQMKARGIPKTTAYEILKKGLIETTLIGRRRYVKLASLDSLLDRISGKGGVQ